MSARFPTITAEHWKEAIARARMTPNALSAQILEEVAQRAAKEPNLAALLSTAGGTTLEHVGNAMMRAGYPDDGLYDRVRQAQRKETAG